MNLAAMSKNELKEALKRAQEQNARLRERLAEAEKSEQLLKSILEYVPEGLTIAEAPDVLIRAISHYGQQLMGRPLESIQGHTGSEILESWKILHPDGVTQAEYEELPLVRAVTKEEDVREEEWILLRPDGKKIPILINAGPMRDEQGTVTGGLVSWMGMEKRKQLEEALRESEKRFRLAISAAKMGAYSRNMQTGQDHWSPEFLAIYGLGPDEPLPLRDGIPTAVHPEDRPRVLAEARAFHGRTVEQDFSSEHRIVRPNGEIRWVHILGKVDFDPVGKQQVIYGLGMDITERKQLEEALRESEARHRALISASSQVLYRMSPDWSEMRQLQGGSFLADTEESNRNWLQDYIHPDDQKRVLEAIDKAVRTGTVFELEHRVSRVDGTVGWTFSRAVPVRNAAGQVVEWFGAANDITERKRSEEALRESEARYRSFFEASRDAVLLTSPEGSILAANKAAQEMFGATEEEFIETGRQAFVDPSDPRLEVFLEERTRTGSARGEFRSRRKDGTIFPTEASSGVFTSLDGNLRTTTILRDITERKRAEEALRESEDLLSRVLDALPVGVFIANEQGGVARVNPAGERIWGGERRVPLDQLHEYKGWWADNGRRIGAHEWAFARAFERGETSINEIIDIECFDGARKTIRNAAVPVRDASGRIISAIAVVEDISAERRAQEALRNREVQYRALAENSPDMIVRYSPDLHYLYVNPRIEHAVGIPPEAFKGKRIGQLGLPEDLQCSIAKAVHAVRKTGQVQTLEWSWKTLVGTKHFQTLFAPEASRDGGVDSVLTISREITSLKHLEEDLRRARDAAEEANRAKSQFLANMSHEIRTPMNGIMGMVELALMGCKDARSREYLGYAKNSAVNLLDIVNDILDLSKIEAGRMELEKSVFRPSEMLESLFAIQGSQAEQKGLRFKTYVDPNVPERLVGDEGRLRQILTNLVGNAVKYTREGEVAVFVTTEVLKQDQEQGEHGRAELVSLVFSIRDTGIGIAPDKLSRIFEPFTRGAQDAEFGGTGLGLTITKQLVELMHGRINVRSTLGQGSTFTVSVLLETAPEGAIPAEPLGTGIAQDRARPLRILLAEDNEINRFMTMELLKLRGHEVITADNGKQALEVLVKEAFDLVLMDAQMPVMDGEEATRRIRAGEAGNPRIPIVALTAYALKGDRERFLAVGMDDYLSKPIDLEELERVLARIGAGDKGTG